LEDCVQDIKSVVEHVRNTSNKDQVILIGHSAGGGMSQKYTEKYPESVAALVTLGSFPPFGGYMAFVNWSLHQPWATFMSVIKNDPKLTLGSPKIYKVVAIAHYFLTDKKGSNVFQSDGRKNC
jgi:pimeloyl-ACP methyl ester carboxylesterase